MPTDPSDQPVAVTGTADTLVVTDQSTVSRTLINNDTVRVVGFTFDTGEQLTDHAAARPALVQLISGRMTVEVAGARHELGAGDCVYLPPNARHALEALEPCRMNLTLLPTVP